MMKENEMRHVALLASAVLLASATLGQATPPVESSQSAGGSASATASPLLAGETRDVPAWTWVTLAREGKNANIQRAAGEACGLAKAGTVQIVGTDTRFGVLVQYRLPEYENRPAGTLCQNGALAFLEPATLATWPAAGSVGEQMRLLDQTRSEAVRRLLGE